LQFAGRLLLFPTPVAAARDLEMPLALPCTLACCIDELGLWDLPLPTRAEQPAPGHAQALVQDGTALFPLIFIWFFSLWGREGICP